MNKESILTKYASHILRAAQIAIVGEFSIKLVGDKNHHEGREVLRGVAKICTDLLTCIDFSQSGDIALEVTAIPAEAYLDKRVGKPLSEYINEAIEARNAAPEKKAIALCEVGQSLLKTAINRLSLTPNQIETIHKVAYAISILDRSSSIRAEHVAEAIQYQSANTEDYFDLLGGDYFEIITNNGQTIAKMLRGEKFTPEQIKLVTDFMLSNLA